MERLTKDNGKEFEPFRYSLEDISTYKIYDLFYEITFKVLQKLGKYEDAEEQGLLRQLPCKVGDTVYVGSVILPIKDMECENIDHKIPLYFPARIVSFRFAKRNWMKIAVKAKWLHEWIDNETGPESAYINSEKKFTISLSGIGKTVFLTESEAETKLKEMGEKDA